MLNKFPDGGLSGPSTVGSPCFVNVLLSSVAYEPGAIRLCRCACITVTVVLSSVFVLMQSFGVGFLLVSLITLLATVLAT